jgi:SNF2 family DNA or RNA helicase
MPGEEPRMMRVLVVTPNQVRVNWRNEFNRFATVPGKVTIVKGGRMKRLRLLTQAITSEDDCAFSACLIGFDTLPNDIEAFEKIPWDLVVIDESHYIKSYNTKRAKCLRRIRDNSIRRMDLTGTFIGNSIMDAYSQFEFLGEGLSGFSSFKAFRAFHGKFNRAAKKTGSAGRLIGSENIPLMRERLARLAFQITKKEAGLNLPDKVPETWEVAMTPRQFDFYQRLAQQLALEIEADMAKGEERRLTAEHILTKLLRLQQICSGYVSWDAVVDPETGVQTQPKRIEQINDRNPKIDAVVELLLDPQNDPKEKCIIWCCFREDIRAISQRLSIEGIKHGCYYGATKDKEREWIVEQFNGGDDEFKVIVANPQTAGEGLNLLGYDPTKPEGSECYCGQEIFFSVNWSYIQRAQAEDRAHRRGTRMPVRITDLMIAGTIDEEIRNRVLAKEKQAWTIQDVREVLDSVLNIDIDFDHGE